MAADSLLDSLELENNGIASNNHIETIETVISSLAISGTAMVHRGEGGYIWKFQYGSVEVWVQLSGESDEDLLTVWSPVMNLPAKDETGLMKKLLAMNWSETFETCFAINSNQVIVLSQRTLAEMHPGEVSRAITLVATIADDNDEILQEGLLVNN